jgi:putative cell wall-binding protein
MTMAQRGRVAQPVRWDMTRHLPRSVFAVLAIALLAIQVAAPSAPAAEDEGATRLTKWYAPGAVGGDLRSFDAKHVTYSALGERAGFVARVLQSPIGHPGEDSFTYPGGSALSPGTYPLRHAFDYSPVEPGAPTPVAIHMSETAVSQCRVPGTGVIHIHELVYGEDNSLLRLSADAEMTCFATKIHYVLRYRATVDPFHRGVMQFVGSNRLGTAIAVSESRWSVANDSTGGAPNAATVVLARSDDFADALAGGPLAAALDAPLLLTSRDSLDAAVLDEIRRVLPFGNDRPVHLLGGPNAIGVGVEQTLRQAGYVVIRHAGADRYATAVQIAHALGDPGGLVLVTGRNFPDGLAASAPAAMAGAAVLLTDGPNLPPATATYLAQHPSAAKLAIGGPAARAVPSATPIVGVDRYETSALVATTLFPANVGAAGLASGENFPDALIGGTHIAGFGGPLLLTTRTSLPASVRNYVIGHVHDAIILYGGPAVISDDLDPVAVPRHNLGSNIRRPLAES